MSPCLKRQFYKLLKLFRARSLVGSQIRTVVNLIAENDDDARKKARRAIYHFLA